MAGLLVVIYIFSYPLDWLIKGGVMIAAGGIVVMAMPIGSLSLTGLMLIGFGFSVQLVFGFLATATTFVITPFVLLVLCAGVLLATVITLRTLKK